MNPRTDTSWATPPRATRHTAAGRRSAAFSLMEVLVAMGIFTVGLVAVAAIFPTAITIQRDTVREVDGRRVAKNARATFLAIARNNVSSPPSNQDNPLYEMSYSHDVTPANRTGSLLPFFTAVDGASAGNPTPIMPMITQPGLTVPQPFDNLLNLEVRSYPKHIENPFRRDYYWYPLLQVTNLTDPSGPSFSATLLIMHRGGTNLPPQIRQSTPITDISGSVITFGNGLLGAASNDADGDGLPDLIQPGDQIIGDDGQVHTVILAEANRLTVDSPTIGSISKIYFAVAIDSANNIKLESNSPLVWVEESIPLSINP